MGDAPWCGLSGYRDAGNPRISEGSCPFWYGTRRNDDDAVGVLAHFSRKVANQYGYRESTLAVSLH